mgnify:FL=1
MNTRAAVMVLAILSQSAGASAGSSLRPMAKDFSRAALGAGIERVAVLSFLPADGSSRTEGTGLTERLTTEFARLGKVVVVERGMLDSLMREHALGASGALDERSLARVGKLLQAQAVVTGSFSTLGGTVELDARLIRLETGAVLAARTDTLERLRYGRDEVSPEGEPIDPREAAAEAQAFQEDRPYLSRAALAREEVAALPASLWEGSRLPGSDGMDWRDAPGGGECASAARRVDSIQAGILDLKARYWAAQLLKKDFKMEDVKVKPGSVITDKALKMRFLRSLQEAYRLPGPPLTLAEIKRFIEADSASFSLHRRCGLTAAR